MQLQAPRPPPNVCVLHSAKHADIASTVQHIEPEVALLNITAIHKIIFLHCTEDRG